MTTVQAPQSPSLQLHFVPNICFFVCNQSKVEIPAGTYSVICLPLRKKVIWFKWVSVCKFCSFILPPLMGRGAERCLHRSIFLRVIKFPLTYK